MAGRSRGDSIGGANLSAKERADAQRRRRDEQRTAREIREFWAAEPGLLERQRRRERGEPEDD